MNGQKLHRQVLDTIEAELASIDCHVTAFNRERMAFVLDRIDGLRTREESEKLAAELERESESMNDEGTLLICDPTTWLGAVECA